MTGAPWPVIAIAAVLGLAIGSFLNVVIYRVPRGESVVSPGSHCPRCDSAIAGRHNVPVLGWLVLRGRCATCALPISVRYPLVEALTGGLFAALTWHVGLSVQLPAFLYLAAVGVALALIDLDVRRVPNAIVVPSYLVAGSLLALAAASGHDWLPLGRAAAGAALVTVLALAVARAVPHATGNDDAKLAGLLGGYLGWLSWDALLVAVLAGAALAVLVGVALRLRPAAPGRPATGHPAPGRPAGDGGAGAVPLAVPVGCCLVVATVLTVLVH